MYVRFPDGTIRYGIINGTVECAFPLLFGDREEAWAAWEEYYDAVRVGVPQTTWVHAYEGEGSGEGEPVIAAYECGAWWATTATRERITGGLDLLDGVPELHEPDHKVTPPWAHGPFCACERRRSA